MLKKEFPIYKKVFDDLKFSIESGKYPKGALLPSENELCKTYNTTRVTVRQALSGLMTIGYITRHHGKGSIVTEPKNGLGILSISGVTAGVGNQSLTTQILQKPVKQAWPHDFFYELTDEERSQGCLFFTRLRHIDGLPVLYEETYINDINLPRFTSKKLDNTSLFKVLKTSYDIEVTEGEQKIWAINGDRNISALLNIKSSHPVVHMKRRLQTNRKNVNIFSSVYCNTAQYFLQDYF